VGHGPLSAPNSLQHKVREKWTAFQPETYPQEEHPEVAHFSEQAKPRDSLAEFLASCRAQGRSPQALKGFRDRLPKLFAYLGEISVHPYTLKARDAQGYTGWLSQHAYAAGTVAGHLYAASAFYAFLKQRGSVVANPFGEIRRVKMAKKLPRGLLKEAQIEKLLDSLARFDEPGHLKAAIARYRLHVVAELMYATGLRVSEVAALKVSDIDFDRGTLTVREGKGGYQRTALLNQFALDVLHLYVQEMRERLFNSTNKGQGPLFGARWSWFGIWVNKELARACAELELPAMRSHGFRHALGYHLLRSGCAIRYIQSILGHKHIRNTEVYTRVEKEDLKRVVDTCHPRKWKAAEHERP
jgi:integrase/recombinase XerD